MNARSQTMTEISIVLPSYQEEENLRLLLPRLKTVLSATGLSYEILVIDSEIPLDKTEAVCKEQQVGYVPRKGGGLYGDAIRTAIDQIQGKFAIFMDADGSHTPEFLPELLTHRNDADVVIASRYIAGGYTENPLALIIMSRVLNWTYSWVLGLRCKDVSNSFKLYRTDWLKPLHLVCDHFDIIEEILFKLCRQNKSTRILEVPFSFKKRMFGQTKRNLVTFILGYFVTMVKLRLSVFGEKIKSS